VGLLVFAVFDFRRTRRILVDNPLVPTRNPPFDKTSATSRATLGWWGIGSITAAALAIAFLPAALLDRAEGTWVEKLSYLSPVWGTCCLIGLATGIRGTQKQGRATRLQRVTALVGTLLSLFAFILLTVIVVVMSS
jgi:hypothetical protein